MKKSKDIDIFSDSTLMSILKRIEKEYVTTLPDELALAGAFSYSKKHKKRMDKLLKNSDSFRYKVLYNTKRRVVAALIAAVMLINMTILVSADARNATGNFFVEIHEDFTDIFFNSPDAPTEIEQAYYPSYVPNGYEVANSIKTTTAVTTEYLNSENISILFNQFIISNSTFTYDAEFTTGEDIFINEYSATLSETKGHYHIYWSTDAYMFDLFGLDKDELIKMAESLVPSA